MVSQKYFEAYCSATELMYSKISSSRIDSFVVDKDYCCGLNGTNQILLMMQIRPELFDGYTEITPATIADLITMIKSTSSEFNLVIRPHLRNWVTKAFEYLMQTEKKMYLVRTSTNYKNPY